MLRPRPAHRVDVLPLPIEFLWVRVMAPLHWSPPSHQEVMTIPTHPK